MKKKIALIFAFVLSSGTAQADSLTAKEVEDINRKLCTYMSISDSTGFYAEEFNKIILDGIGVSQASERANKAVSKYLNDNKSLKLILARDFCLHLSFWAGTKKKFGGKFPMEEQIASFFFCY